MISAGIEKTELICRLQTNCAIARMPKASGSGAVMRCPPKRLEIGLNDDIRLEIGLNGDKRLEIGLSGPELYY